MERKPMSAMPSGVAQIDRLRAALNRALRGKGRVRMR